MVLASMYISLLNIIERSSILKFNLTNLNLIETENSFDDAVSSVEDVRSGCLYYINQNGDVKAVVDTVYIDQDCLYNGLNTGLQG